MNFSTVGTDCYCAPEVKDKKQQGKANDVWALGLLLIEMCTQKPIWEFDFDFAIRSMSDPKQISDFIDNLDAQYDPIKPIIKKILNPNPRDRLKIEGILKNKLVRRSMNRIRKKRKMSMHDSEVRSDEKVKESSGSSMNDFDRKDFTHRATNQL